jgi:hypothetical protein
MVMPATITINRADLAAAMASWADEINARQQEPVPHRFSEQSVDLLWILLSKQPVEA